MLSISGSTSSSCPSSASSYSSSSLSSSLSGSSFGSSVLSGPQTIPEFAQKLIGSMTPRSITESIARGDAESVTVYGAVLKYLPAKDIVEFLKLFSSEDCSNPFYELEDDSTTYQKTAHAYFDIYFHLYEVLPRADFALVVSPLLLETGGYFITEDLICNRMRIMNRYTEMWQLVSDNQLADWLVLPAVLSGLGMHQIIPDFRRTRPTQFG